MSSTLFLTHLLFADDSFLFCRAATKECTVLKELLALYEQASGQAINFQKSEVFFSKNTPSKAKETLTGILGVSECLKTGKYLALPSMVGRSIKSLFGYLRDRTWKRIQNWTCS